MNHTVKTIPDYLVENYGNQTEVARKLQCHRGTVNKYAYDRKGERHAVVNGVLMVHPLGRGR